MLEYLVSMAVPMLMNIPKDISLGRMAESVVLLGLIWSKLKPHLNKVDAHMTVIETRLSGLETAVKVGFNNGQLRFEKIEFRLSKLEKPEPNNIP